MKNIKVSPFIQDIILTTLTVFLTTAATIVTTKLLANGLGAERFGAYSLSRRIVSTIAPFSTVMMGDVIVRFLALSKNQSQRFHYLVGGIFLGIAPSCALFLFSLPFKGVLSGYLLGSYNPSLLIASMVMLVGYSAFSVLYAFYRGAGKIGKANFWQLLLMGVGPMAVSLFCRRVTLSAIVLMMAALFLTAIVPLFREVLRRDADLKSKPMFDVGSIKELLRYGLPRTPSGVMLAGFLTIGPLLLSHFGSMAEVGYLVVGQSLFRTVEAGLVAFGLVALPKVTQLFANDQHDYLENRINDIVMLIFQLGLFSCLHLLLWSKEIISVWLGPEYADAVPLTRIFIFSLVPYFAYVMMRSIIDAIEIRPINTRNLYISFAATLAASLILTRAGFGARGLAMATSFGFALLGVLTTLYIARHYRLRWHQFQIGPILALNALLIVAVYLVKQRLLGFFNNDVYVLFIGFIVEMIVVASYLLVLNKLKAQWIGELRKRLSFAI